MNSKILIFMPIRVDVNFKARLTWKVKMALGDNGSVENEEAEPIAGMSRRMTRTAPVWTMDGVAAKKRIWLEKEDSGDFNIDPAAANGGGEGMSLGSTENLNDNSIHTTKW